MIDLNNLDSEKPDLVDKHVLAKFSPIAKLSSGRLDELAEVCIVEQVSKNLDPRRMSIEAMEALYLIEGDLGIRYDNGKKLVLRGGTDAAKHPIDSERLKIKDTIAITPIKVVHIDLDLLDIMLTWDQISGYKPPESEQAKLRSNIKLDADSFNAFKLKNGVFRQLPAANIETMFARLTRVDVGKGQVIVTQGNNNHLLALVSQSPGLCQHPHAVNVQTWFRY
jgi:hypothetical protein